LKNNVSGKETSEVLFMHEYSIDNRKQDKIAYYIAILSIITALPFNVLLKTIFDNLALQNAINMLEIHMGVSLTITSSLIFTLLYTAFKKLLWHKCYFFLKVPNLSGKWICKGHSYKYATDDEYEWESEIAIKQEWDKIGITQTTKDSDSFSTSIIGGIKIEDNDEVLLSYVYANIPRNNTPELAKHEGLVKLRFAKDLKIAKGDYFNDRSRQTYGTMELTKKA
jgi:hypothetical protein